MAGKRYQFNLVRKAFDSLQIAMGGGAVVETINNKQREKIGTVPTTLQTPKLLFAGERSGVVGGDDDDDGSSKESSSDNGGLEIDDL